MTTVTTLDPAEFAEPVRKGGSPLGLSCRRGRAQVPDGRQFHRGLLPARCEGHAAAPPRSVMNFRRLIRRAPKSRITGEV
jgi:hypothetical protein